MGFHFIEIHALLCGHGWFSGSCHKSVCGQDRGMVKWVHVQLWSVGRQEGRRINTRQYTYSPLQGDVG